MDELEQIRERNRWNPDKKEKEESEKPKSSLPKGTIVLMLVTAGIIDAVQAFLLLFAIGAVLNTFISIFMVFVFFLWFMMHGVSFVSPKRLMGMGGGFLVELIPVLDALPAWTAAVWYTISTTKILETVEKLPGGKAAGFVVQSQMAATNASRTRQIANTHEWNTTQFREGGKKYAGTKGMDKVLTIDEIRAQKKISPEQLKLDAAKKGYTDWKTQMTDIDKMRGVKRKYADPEEKTTQDTLEDSETQDMEEQRAA